MRCVSSGWWWSGLALAAVGAGAVVVVGRRPAPVGAGAVVVAAVVVGRGAAGAARVVRVLGLVARAGDVLAPSSCRSSWRAACVVVPVVVPVVVSSVLVAPGSDTVRAGSESSRPDAAAHPPVASTPAPSRLIRSFVIARPSSFRSWNEDARGPPKGRASEGKALGKAFARICSAKLPRRHGPFV